MHRRDFLTLAAGSLAAFRSGTASAASSRDVPATGKVRPELAAFDDWARDCIARHQIPGVSLALARNGEVIYARGFGFADRDAKIPVEPDSLFRIASVSKPVTAVAVLKLVEEGRLKLEDRVFDRLSQKPFFEEGGEFDERWKRVTIEQCLAHTGGWDRDKSYDPMFRAAQMAKSMDITLPLRPEQIIRYQLGKPLDFDPGARYAYSNFGYSILGRIIEKVSRQPYEQYVQEAVFKPLGIARPRIGGSLAEERADGEVCYYDVSNGMGLAVTGPDAGKVQTPISYGVWRQETLDAHGGWVASAIDLVRFAAALDLTEGESKTRSGLLRADTVRNMLSPHATSGTNSFYGLGWMLRKEENQYIARHGGALACTAAMLMHLPSGINLAFLTNLGKAADGSFLGRSLEQPLMKLVREIK